jgi:hypothetical protein
MAILETGRSSFTDPFLKNLCAEKNFLWLNKDPQGRSGGILVGLELDVFDIGAIDEGDFYVKFHLCNKENNFKWVLVAVYGPAQIPLKEQFLTELVQMISHERLPVLVGGDFNILRHADEKNKDNFDQQWPFLFNCVIDGLNLRELEMSGRQYTGVNSLLNPTYEKHDRVRISTEWDLSNPLSTVVVMPRDISDHTPLLIDMRMPSTGNN